jgi:FtsP/CotA-like multicopper oxidase with cupredoxin domain
MMVINNMYPAPLVEAWEGDTLEITVHNRLHLGQSIHWHGMRQVRS